MTVVTTRHEYSRPYDLDVWEHVYSVRGLPGGDGRGWVAVVTHNDRPGRAEDEQVQTVLRERRYA